MKSRSVTTHPAPINRTILAFLLCMVLLAKENDGFQTQSSTRQQFFCVASHTSHHGGEPNNNDILMTTVTSRRKVLETCAASSLSLLPQSSRANDNNNDGDDSFVQRGNGFAYRFVPPSEMEPGAKPVKTHLFEINWKSTATSKYTYGITIDPVRIQNLKEFGTPEEVAAKVVLAEVNRDGVFDVTLVKDPVAIEEDGTLSYILNYLSQGKRGDKRFVAKFCIQNQRLYALTAQVAEADYKNKEDEIMQAIGTFRVMQ